MAASNSQDVLKVGDNVSHILSKENMTISKINGGIAVCKLEVVRQLKCLTTIEIDVAICQISNLIKIN